LEGYQVDRVEPVGLSCEIEQGFDVLIGAVSACGLEQIGIVFEHPVWINRDSSFLSVDITSGLVFEVVENLGDDLSPISF
jgi:hypothetical protein